MATAMRGTLGRRQDREQKKAVAVNTVVNREEVARVAYALYVERGCVDGYDLDDWLKAEIILSRQNGQK